MQILSFMSSCTSSFSILHLCKAAFIVASTYYLSNVSVKTGHIQALMINSVKLFMQYL